MDVRPRRVRGADRSAGLRRRPGEGLPACGPYVVLRLSLRPSTGRGASYVLSYEGTAGPVHPLADCSLADAKGLARHRGRRPLTRAVLSPVARTMDQGPPRITRAAGPTVPRRRGIRPAERVAVAVRLSIPLPVDVTFDGVRQRLAGEPADASQPVRSRTS
ncbi:hypothetical protein GCM10010253_02550 [Streptomyces badius]|uniref:Uncharacterized protein n=1 Tax=Streptomyces badius TaxID=1941 RepID=A0ABQ2SN93_STRBA|nr:hypothetical protein GCM10010253_02550 [Streptomyces badius]